MTAAISLRFMSSSLAVSNGFTASRIRLHSSHLYIRCTNHLVKNGGLPKDIQRTCQTTRSLRSPPYPAFDSPLRQTLLQASWLRNILCNRLHPIMLFRTVNNFVIHVFPYFS